MHKQVTNFTSSLLKPNALKPEHSAEDLLRIGRQEDSAVTQSPQRSQKRLHPARPLQKRIQNAYPKIFRPSQPESVISRGVEIEKHQNADSFGQLSGIRPKESISYANGCYLN